MIQADLAQLMSRYTESFHFMSLIAAKMAESFNLGSRDCTRSIQRTFAPKNQTNWWTLAGIIRATNRPHHAVAGGATIFLSPSVGAATRVDIGFLMPLEMPA